jgi:hypothetical protein
MNIPIQHLFATSVGPTGYMTSGSQFLFSCVLRQVSRQIVYAARVPCGELIEQVRFSYRLQHGGTLAVIYGRPMEVGHADERPPTGLQQLLAGDCVPCQRQRVGAEMVRAVHLNPDALICGGAKRRLRHHLHWI